MRFIATTLGVLVFCAELGAQSLPSANSPLNTAQPQQDKFPAEWFTDTAQDPYHPLSPFNPANASAPLSVTPYSAETALSYETVKSPSGSFAIHGATMRDSSGRSRADEEIQVGEIGKDAAAPSVSLVTQVEVNDPVAHCSFRWVEPARKDTEKIATVQCQPRSTTAPRPQEQAAVQVDPMEAKMTRQVVETLHESPDQTIQIEPLGEKVIEGLKAFGIRQTLMDTHNNSGRPQVTEIWWSAQIKEILLTKPIGEPAGRPMIEMTNIKLQEPDPALFYPPGGYKIVPQSQMPH